MYSCELYVSGMTSCWSFFKGGGSFDDSDLLDVSGGDYKPDGGRSGGKT